MSFVVKVVCRSLV
ncbi:hypothetical protein L1D05_22465 [Vibrio vulnificus]|nr:hypothetical protein [Vibrio vulnificus]